MSINRSKEILENFMGTLDYSLPYAIHYANIERDARAYGWDWDLESLLKEKLKWAYIRKGLSPRAPMSIPPQLRMRKI